MGNAPRYLHDTSRCVQCGVRVPVTDVLRGMHVCDPGDLAAQEAVRLAGQIELMHFEIHEYLRSSAGRRQLRFEQWCREHGR